MTKKKSIVYIDDYEGNRDIAAISLKMEFPDYNIIMDDGAINCATRIIESSGGVEEIAIVCTDGNLGGGNKGWNVVRDLNSKGYNGSAVYMGYSNLPNSERELYDTSIDKKSGNEFIDVVQKCLWPNR